MFVNNYLSTQPDLKRDYRIWIARYSEYKPDLRLTYWQLCPDGRVTGIQGYVDINVFNGYQRQFEEYLAEETIK
jgi:lysozyme